MPIRLEAATNAFLASFNVSLAADTSSITGSHVGPDSVSGTLAAILSGNTANLEGLFTEAPNRTGTIATTLGNGTAFFTDGSGALSFGVMQPISASAGEYPATVSGQVALTLSDPGSQVNWVRLVDSPGETVIRSGAVEFNYTDDEIYVNKNPA